MGGRSCGWEGRGACARSSGGRYQGLQCPVAMGAVGQPRKAGGRRGREAGGGKAAARGAPRRHRCASLVCRPGSRRWGSFAAGRSAHHAPRTTHHAPHHAPRTTHHAPRTLTLTLTLTHVDLVAGGGVASQSGEVARVVDHERVGQRVVAGTRRVPLPSRLTP